MYEKLGIKNFDLKIDLDIIVILICFSFWSYMYGGWRCFDSLFFVLFVLNNCLCRVVVQRWDGEGLLLFMFSSGVYDVYNNGFCDEVSVFYYFEVVVFVLVVFFFFLVFYMVFMCSYC